MTEETFFKFCVNEMHERREHRRISTDLFMVIRSIEKKEGDLIISHTRDISSCGVYAYASAKLSVGDRVALRIHPDSDWAEGGAPAEFSGEGAIIRVERNAKIHATQNGIAIKLANELSMI